MTSTPPGFSAPAPPSVSGAPAATGDNVYRAVASWARRAPGGRLNAWLVGGVVDAVGLWLFLPVLWPLACALLSIAAVGGWGLAAQRLAALGAEASARRRRALEAAMFAALVAGTLAAILAFYGILLAILGPSWKL